MSKQKSMAVILLKCVGAALLLYLVLQLLLALLTVKGALPEAKLFHAQVCTAVLAVLPGGIYAGRHSGLGALTAAMLVAAGVAVTALLLGLLIWDGIAQTAETGIRLLAMAAGGVLAGLLSARGGKKRRKKRRGTGAR